MKNIIIVSKAINKRQRIPNTNGKKALIGLDRGINILKKPFSEKLQDKLLKKFEEMKLDYNVEVSYRPLQELIDQGADLILISPFIKNHVDLIDIDKNKYIFLSEEEFLEGKIENIIKRL